MHCWTVVFVVVFRALPDALLLGYCRQGVYTTPHMIAFQGHKVCAHALRMCTQEAHNMCEFLMCSGTTSMHTCKVYCCCFRVRVFFPLPKQQHAVSRTFFPFQVPPILRRKNELTISLLLM